MKNDKKFPIKITRAIGSPMSVALHTILFAGVLSLYFTGVDFDSVLLALTTVVSLEAIYLAIFIQMTVNREERRLSKVSRDINEIQENVGELAEDVEDITEEMEKDEKEDEQDKAESAAQLRKIESSLHELLREIEAMQKRS